MGFAAISHPYLIEDKFLAFFLFGCGFGIYMDAFKLKEPQFGLPKDEDGPTNT